MAQRNKGRVDCNGGNPRTNPAVRTGPSAFEMIALGVSILALVIVAVRRG